jgi:hypothetical protein
MHFGNELKGPPTQVLQAENEASQQACMSIFVMPIAAIS